MGNAAKVAVLGCNGIGQKLATVVRQAAYMIAQARPDEVLLVSSGALTGDVPEALEAARRYPLLVIDGCQPRCGSAIAAGKGLDVAARIHVPQVMREARISIVCEDRKGLGGNGMALARRVADAAIQQIDALLSQAKTEAV